MSMIRLPIRSMAPVLVEPMDDLSISLWKP